MELKPKSVNQVFFDLDDREINISFNSHATQNEGLKKMIKLQSWRKTVNLDTTKSATGVRPNAQQLKHILKYL